MNTIKATWTNGRIIPSEPVDWPEGSELLVEQVAPSVKCGLDETVWRDDADALADWKAWTKTIQPLVYTEEERESLTRYNEDFRRYNLEAVRKQMSLGEGE